MLKNAAIVPYIPVANVARARKFYEEKVGLEAKEEYAGGIILSMRQRLVGLHVSIRGSGHVESQHRILERGRCGRGG